MSGSAFAFCVLAGAICVAALVWAALRLVSFLEADWDASREEEIAEKEAASGRARETEPFPSKSQAEFEENEKNYELQIVDELEQSKPDLREHQTDLLRKFAEGKLSPMILSHQQTITGRRRGGRAAMLEADFAEVEHRMAAGLKAAQEVLTAEQVAESAAIVRSMKSRWSFKENNYRKVLIIGVPGAFSTEIAALLAKGMDVQLSQNPLREGEDPVRSLQCLEEDGWIARVLANDHEAFRLPKSLPEGLVDAVVIPRRDPLGALCAWALEGQEGQVEVSSEQMQEFRAHWVALELAVYNAEHYFGGAFRMLTTGIDLPGMASELSRRGFRVAEAMSKTMAERDSSRITNFEEVREFVQNLREIQTDETWHLEAATAFSPGAARAGLW